MRGVSTRLGLVAGLLVLLGTTTPPAQATTVMDAVFTAAATVGFPGLGYPVQQGGTVLPTSMTTKCLPLAGEIVVTNCHLNFNGTRSLQMFSTTCTDTSTNFNKGPLPPEHTGACSFTASGTVTGHCAASGGQVTGTYVNSLGQRFTFGFHFHDVGGIVGFSGHWTKLHLHAGEARQHGLLVGDAAASPPLSTTAPGQSCLAGTARDFTWVGNATFVTVPL